MSADANQPDVLHDVLVVDDDPVIRRILHSALASEGRNIEVATDGREGLQQFARTRARLVVTDWEMPGLAGPELVREIRKIDEAQTYIVMLTSRSGTDDLLEGLDAGADDYIRKPFSSAELRARLAVGDRMLGLQDRLRELGSTDELTGLLNRRAIYERVRVELDRCSRGISPCSIALIDVDKFKTVNDTAGHRAGDELLKNLAASMADKAAAYGYVGRWGGDEFLVVMSGVSTSAAERIGTELANSARKLMVPRVGNASLSIGISTATLGETRQLEQMMPEADAAMYRVKRAGGDGALVFDGEHLAA